MTSAKKAAKKAPQDKTATKGDPPSTRRGTKPPAADPRESTGTHAHDTALSAPEETKTARRKLDSSDPKVTVRIPRAFNLQVLGEGGSRMVRYEAGVDEMPESHAKHDYAIANGVEIVE